MVIVSFSTVSVNYCCVNKSLQHSMAYNGMYSLLRIIVHKSVGQQGGSGLGWAHSCIGF